MASALPYISAAMSVMQGFQQMQMGKAQKKINAVKALQVKADSEQDELNAELKMGNVLDNVRRTNSTVIANAAAGNIDPNTGSAMVLQNANLAYAQKDLKSLEIMKNRYKSFGEIQYDIMQEEGELMESAGKTAFLSSIGTAAGTMYKYGTPSSSGSGSSGSYRSDYGSTDYWKGTPS